MGYHFLRRPFGAGAFFIVLVFATSPSRAQSPGRCATEQPYDPARRPDPEGKPTEVGVGIYVVDIERVDDVDQTFRADLFAILRWRDPRLVASVQRSGFHACRIPRDEVWNPAIVLFNQGSYDRQLPDVVRVDREGRVEYTHRFRGLLRSPLRLQEFPLDTQVLPITFLSIEYGPEQLELAFDDTAPSRAEAFAIAGWNVIEETHHVDILDTRATAATGERLVRFVYELHVERELGYYVFRVIVPLMFIVLMSWAVFWIDNKQAFLRSLCLVALIALAGCSTAPPPRTAAMARLQADVTRYELRLLVYDYASYFSAVVGDAADTILGAEEDRDVQRAALRFKIHAIPTIQKAVFQSDPLAGLADAWALSVQMRRFFENGNGREVFGRSQRVAVDAARHLEEEVVVLVESVVGVETRVKSSPEVERWAEANPLSTLAFGRHANSLDLATVTAAKWGSGALQSVGQIEELVRDLTDRLAVYAEQTPHLARWEAELLALEAETRIIKPLWADIESLERSAASLDGSVKGIREFVDETPALVATERARILEALRKERAAILGDVDRQRLSTLAVFSAEREEIFSSVEALRGVLLGDFRDARTTIQRDLDEGSERLAIETDSLLNRLFLRALLLLGLAFIGALIVVWVAKRRPVPDENHCSSASGDFGHVAHGSGNCCCARLAFRPKRPGGQRRGMSRPLLNLVG